MFPGPTGETGHGFMSLEMLLSTEAPGEPEYGRRYSSWARGGAWQEIFLGPDDHGLALPTGSPSYPYWTTQNSDHFGSKKGGGNSQLQNNLRWVVTSFITEGSPG